MATIPTPAAGAKIKANDLLFLLGGAPGRKPRFHVHMAAAKSVPNNALTTVAFDTVDFDDDSAYSTVTGLYTCVTPGEWIFNANTFFASNATGIRRGYLTSTGAPGTGRPNDISAAVDTIGLSNPSLQVRLSVGSTVNVTMFQNSGGALNAGTGPNMSFSGIWLGA